MRKLCVVLVAMGMCGWVAGQPIMGASPNSVGSGARAMGQANAFIGVADDATAASWNPGGLPQIEKPELSLAVEGLYRRSDLSSGSHPEANNTHSFGLEDLNYLSLVCPFQWREKNAVASLNYLKQYRLELDTRFNYATGLITPFATIDVLERYSFAQHGSFTSLGPAFGIEVSDKLSLGLAFNIWNHGLTGASEYRNETDSISTVTITPTLFPLPPGTSVTANSSTDTYTVTDGYSLVLGGLYRFSKEWTVGAVIKPGHTLYLDFDRRFTSHVLSPAGSPITTHWDFDVDLEMPTIAGLGTAYRPSDALTLSMDLTWTDWSEYIAYDTNFNAEINPLSGVRLNAGGDTCDDTVSCRFGAEYLLIRDDHVIPLRCGLAYDPAPAVDDVDDYYTASVGVGLQIGRFMADLAYELRWGKDVIGGGIRGLSTSEDVLQHRILLSLILYL
ncbi:MAG: hypothetical protein HN742_23600 [Lentisphaerae bacterium]|nr:hypothetical protein [Lentisphaerota bacterium]MBT5605213.1 hypothetical protein [Lentisphaerota bacterium]MBT7054335.1 hypothetical protein [Lentisphaerota bacterium]MBT7844881.1 hypothetical protein [Lentisphaerota bacterium]